MKKEFIVLIICFLFLSSSFFAQNNFKDDNLLVGTRYYKWTDISRLDKEYKRNDYREIHVQVWFPIDKQKSKNLKRASYFPELEKAKPFLINWSEKDFTLAEKIKTNSVLTSKISWAKKKFPTILFSPGLGGHTSFFTYYAERLASLGYVVVGVNHKYDSNYIINKDGEVIYRNLKFHDDLKKLKIPEEISVDEYHKKKGKRIKVLGEDLVFCLNQLKNINKSDFSNRLDLTKVGVFGHSIGGGVAIDASKLDKSFEAIINMDGTPSYWALQTGMNRNFMYIEDLKDISQKGNKIQYDRRNDFCKKVKSNCYRVMLANTNHNSFLDSNYHEAKTDIERAKVLKILNLTFENIQLFFDKYIKNKNIEIKDLGSEDLKILSFVRKNSDKQQ